MFLAEVTDRRETIALAIRSALDGDSQQGICPMFVRNCSERVLIVRKPSSSC